MSRKREIMVLVSVIALSIILFLFLVSKNYFRDRQPVFIPTNPNPIRIAIDIWPGNFWAIIAQEKGFFKEQHINAQLIDVSDDYDGSIDDLADGENIDTNSIAVFDMVEKNFEGHDLVAIVVTDSSLTGEGIAVKPEIRDITQLAGKRIGVQKNSYLDFYLDVALGNFNINADDYIKVDLPHLIISEKEFKRGQSEVIRFRISSEDKKKIEKKATEAGYASISSFIRAVILSD